MWVVKLALFDGDVSAVKTHRHMSGTFEARPAAGNAGRTYWATTRGGNALNVLFLDTGAAWVVVGFTPASCRVYRAVDQNFLTGLQSAISFDSERFDNDAMHDLVVNPDRITIKTPGIYLVTGTIAWQPNSSGDRLVFIQLNGAATIAACRGRATAANERNQTVTTTYQFAVADYVVLGAMQDSGFALDVEAQTNHSPEFSAVRVGYIE